MKPILKSKNLKNHGDTIVEVILSIAVLGTAMAAAFVSTTHSLQIGTDAGNRNRALGFIQQQLEQIKSAEVSSAANLSTYVADNQPFCIDPSSGGKLAAGSDGFCSVCVSGGVFVGIIPSDSSCAPGSIAAYAISVTYSGDTSRIFTTKAQWAAPNGTGRDSSTGYYKLPISGVTTGPVGVASVGMTVMSNPDINGGLGPTARLCVNGGSVCVTKAYPAAGTPCTSFGTSAPLPEGSHSTTYDAQELCSDVSLPLNLSSVTGPITDVSFEFVAPTDYNGYRVGHVGDRNYYMDSNFILRNVSIAGYKVAFVQSSYSLGLSNMKPPDGGTIGPYILWADWQGTARFTVTPL